ALSHAGQHAALQVLDTGSERADELRAIIKSDQKKLVPRIRGLEKLHGGLPGLLDLVGHAAAHVKNDANRNRHVLAAELNNLLPGVVLKHAEIFFFEACDEAVVGVGHRDVDQRQLHVQLDWLAVITGWKALFWRVLLRGGTLGEPGDRQ